MDCDVLNLPACMMDVVKDFVLSFINAPIKPLLSAVQALLTTPASVDIFSSIWAVMVYVISLFYGLFFIIAGLNFIISGYNAERRAKAKQWLQNVVLMMLFVQASFLIYKLVAEIAANLTAGVMGLIDPSFFLFTLDSIVNSFLQIFFGVFYVLAILLTVILLVMNFVLASMGVLYLPFGIFFYFIPPLRDIGRFIMNLLAFTLFLPFFASLILLAYSAIAKLPIFSSFKILFMIGAFMLINILMLLLAILAIARSVMSVMRSDIARGILFLKGNFLASSSAKTAEPEGREYWSNVRKDYRERVR